MIKKIKSIGNLAVFKAFDWDKEVLDRDGKVCDFKEINIIYGRNYSGKTTLSRILRAMETGELSDKFENPSFSVALADETQITQTAPTNHGKKIRVFNEDFVRDNLRFITDPDDSIKSFAILGDDNNKIEKEIEILEGELGSKKEGKETGSYAKKIQVISDFKKANQEHTKAESALEKQLSIKATGGEGSIKQNSERYGDINYNITKFKTDIKEVNKSDYQAPTDKQLAQYEKLIDEKLINTITPFHAPNLNFLSLTAETKNLVTKSISESDKIEELVNNAVLNRWVNEGRSHHKHKRDTCAFCANLITDNRWKELEKHFDEESEQLERNIEALIKKIDKEKTTVTSALSIDKARFYSEFHNKLDELDKALSDATDRYAKSLDNLATQLKSRKEDILHSKLFERPDDASDDLIDAWGSHETMRVKSDEFSKSLHTKQAEAKKALRLKEVSDYLVTIQYQERLSSIDALEIKREKAEQEKNSIEEDIRQKEELITSKKRELNDEGKGAQRVNDYLNHFFGHQFLSLEAKKDDATGEDSKVIRFEVIRDSKKAYHLSEGECSLLAFCYFLAKLQDIDTKDSKPIIWIDDPISSLDSNHIFFVYSLLNTEIVSSGRFEQLFISTHNLDFLKYLKRLNGKYASTDGTQKDYQKCHFIVVRQDKTSSISMMPEYLKKYVTEFNYLFHQIHKCAAIKEVNDSNYITFYNFANNARKFFEIYLYYKYPDQGMSQSTLSLFFGDERIPAVFIDRINNEYSHLCAFERGSTPIEVPEMQKAAKRIVERLKEDKEQYAALLKSIGEPAEAEAKA